MDEFTLVVPSYNNRGFFLNRLCEYYSNVDFRILIVDSSLKPQKIAIKNKNIEYVHCPTFNYFEKLEFAFSQVKTPYSALCADDDFSIPSGIIQCVSFLKENKEYASCQGTSSYFFNSFNTKFYPLFPERYNLDVSQNSVEERIVYLFENYMYLHYAVHRTETLHKISKELKSTSSKIYGLVEYFFNIISLLEGKHKKINVFYSVRQFDLNSAYKKYPKLLDIKNCDEANAELENIKRILSTLITEKTKNDSMIAASCIDFIFNESPFFYGGFNSSSDENNGEVFKNRKVKKVIASIPYIHKAKNYYSILMNKVNRTKWHYVDSRKNALILKYQDVEGYPKLYFKGMKELNYIYSIIRKHKKYFFMPFSVYIW